MMRQYQELKAAHEDCLLFFRLGDFYELFYDDALLASKALQITLTSRDVGGGRRAPMCGVPHHAADQYIARLAQAGHKVAVCEQMEDPASAKGVVRREVVRIVTPGTLLNEAALEAKENRYLCAVAAGRDGYGLAACDLSTGEFVCGGFRGPGGRTRLLDEIERLRPPEALLDPALEADGRLAEEIAARSLACRTYETPAFRLSDARRRLSGHFSTLGLEGFGVDDDLAVRAAGAAFAYLEQTQKTTLAQITRLLPIRHEGALQIDAATRRHLELVESARDGKREGSLLAVVDETVTPMGARLLRHWLQRPLAAVEPIQARQEAVGRFVEDPLLRGRVRSVLEKLYDVERLIGRVALKSANGRDLSSLRASLEALPSLLDALQAEDADSSLGRLRERIDPLSDVASKIASVLVDDPPASVQEGGLIRDGYDQEVDELRRAQRDGKAWLAGLEAEERERTGIKSLKVGFNKVFGYFIEVTRPNLDRVPSDYVRRQTMANAERFVTTELKEKEALILGAEERVLALEHRLFCELRDWVGERTGRVQATAAALAELDVYAGLAEAAAKRGWTRPEVAEGGGIDIRGGRHPVVEAAMGGGYVPNDVRLNQEECRLMLLTGPNMAGKSTYLRQTALIVLLAQMGSWVPAAEARIGVVDRIFTRVGASDDLATGRSTFMVEMTETGAICHNATNRSLVLIDELGRGTSTYDGVALAQAVAEYLHDHVQCLTVMATHYHELTALADRLDLCRNYRVDVAEQDGRIVFLYRVAPGGADRSYGVNVARMAGLPARVLARAEQILLRLERERPAAAAGQLSLFDLPPPPAADLERLQAAEPVIEELAGLEVDRMTPLEALNCLARLQEALRAALQPDARERGA